MESKNIIGCHWSTQFICLFTFCYKSQHSLSSAWFLPSGSLGLGRSSDGLLPQRRGGLFRKNIDQEKIKWLNIEQFLESEMRCK